MNNTNENYKNMYWKQIHNKKSEKITTNNNMIDLSKRIDFFEQKVLYGTIKSKNGSFYTILNDKYGEFSCHESKLQNFDFNNAHIRKKVKFQLYYYNNKYYTQNVNLIINDINDYF